MEGQETPKNDPPSDQRTETAPEASSSYWHRLTQSAMAGTKFLPKLGGIGGVVLTIAAAILIAVALLWVIDKVFFFYVAKSYVDEVANILDLNHYLANALVLLTFALAAVFARYLWSFSRRKRLVGTAGLLALLIGHSLVLWWGTRNVLVDRNGMAEKCYVLSRDGSVTYGEHPGIDPATGRECRAVKPEMVERLQKYAAGERPQLISDPNPTFFDPRSGEPIVWYYKASDGTIELYDLMGFQPDTGAELIPVTKEIVEEWKKQWQHKMQQAPKLISDPSTYMFFDPRNGQPRAWYWRNASGHYEFYDHPGFQPMTGDRLMVVTKQVLSDWQKQTQAPSPERVPQRIDPTTYPFFDPATGAPRVWYWRAEDGSYEFYDAPGFQPRTGDKLLLVTRDIAAKWQQEMVQRKKFETQPPLEPSARALLEDYINSSNGDQSQVLDFTARNFAPTVSYYGKTMSRQQVIDDKRDFTNRWPQRAYALQPETVQINCDAMKSSCDASGEITFQAASPALDKISTGTARFELQMAFSNGRGTITSEDGNVIDRQSGSLSSNSPPAPLDQPRSGAQPGAPATSYYYVANARPPDAYLALRTAPSSSDGERIATMPNGTLLQVLRRQPNGWWYVRMIGTGLQGWALSQEGNESWIVCCQAVGGLSPQQSQGVGVQLQGPMTPQQSQQLMMGAFGNIIRQIAH